MDRRAPHTKTKAAARLRHFSLKASPEAVEKKMGCQSQRGPAGGFDQGGCGAGPTALPARAPNTQGVGGEFTTDTGATAAISPTEVRAMTLAILAMLLLDLFWWLKR